MTDTTPIPQVYDVTLERGLAGLNNNESPSSKSWHQFFRRRQIVQSLEAVQDLIAVSLCMGLFCVMALQLKNIFQSLLTTPQFHEITADILFILILVELFRLLIIYLQEQRVSIGVSVEIAIVSVLREVIVNGVLETDWQQMLALCLFLATCALLLIVRVWLPPTFEGVDPEGNVSARILKQKKRWTGDTSNVVYLAWSLTVFRSSCPEASSRYWIWHGPWLGLGQRRWRKSGRKNNQRHKDPVVAYLPHWCCRPVLTAVARCHLSGEQCLPDSANARTPLASMEVLAVDAASGGGGHLCQWSSRPLYCLKVFFGCCLNGKTKSSSRGWAQATSLTDWLRYLRHTRSRQWGTGELGNLRLDVFPTHRNKM